MYDLIDDIFTLFLDFVTSLFTADERGDYSMTKRIVLFVSTLNERKQEFFTVGNRVLQQARTDGMNILVDRAGGDYSPYSVVHIPIEGKVTLNKPYAVAFGVDSWDYSEEATEYDEMPKADREFISKMREDWARRNLPEGYIDQFIEAAGRGSGSRIPLIKEVRTVADNTKDQDFIGLKDAKEFVERMVYISKEYVKVPSYAMRNYLASMAKMDQN